MSDKRIIIVDDSLELGRLLKATLNTLNKDLEVVVVPNGEEALKEAPKGVDLLIADYKLPGISGSELVGRIRTKFPTVKVIMISGMMEDQLTQSARELEVDFRLKKPMEIESSGCSRTCLHLQERGGERQGMQTTKSCRAGPKRSWINCRLI